MTQTDRSQLRDPAGKYAEIAHSLVMTRRREKWRLHNDLRAKTLPFHIEFVFRDTNRLCGAMRERIQRACDIVREVTSHPEGRKQA